MTHAELMIAIETLRNELPEAPMSPYRLAKIVNETFSIDLPPQMMYNYVRNGLLNVVEQSGSKKISKDEALAFIERYGLRNIVAK